MQNRELQAMTVVQLRKLAKEKGVKLSAGIDKEGIVARISEALGAAEDTAAEPIMNASAGKERIETEAAAIARPQNSAAVVEKPEQEKTAEEDAAPKKDETAQDMQKLQEAALSAVLPPLSRGLDFALGTIRRSRAVIGLFTVRHGRREAPRSARHRKSRRGSSRSVRWAQPTALVRKPL